MKDLKGIPFTYKSDQNKSRINESINIQKLLRMHSNRYHFSIIKKDISLESINIKSSRGTMKIRKSLNFPIYKGSKEN